MTDTKTMKTCEVCGENTEMFVNWMDGEIIKVRRDCACDRKKTAEVRAEREQAEREMTISRLKVNSMMNRKHYEIREENLKITPDNKEAQTIIKNYIKNIKKMIDDGQGLLFWGPVGTGKTYTAAMLANTLIERYQVPVIMTSFVDIMQIKKETGWGKEDKTKKICEVPVLIIDDLGVERNNAYALEVIYEVIDTRYRNRLPLILTSNLSPADMMGTSDVRFSRIYDRIFEMCCPIEFKGISWRKREAANRFDNVKKSLLEG